MTAPALDRPAVVVAAAAYAVVVVVIGVWAARRTHDARDFFIAGQGVGLLATGLATVSAAFSGFVFLGGPGLTYRIGLASLWIVLPIGITGGLLCWSVGRRLRLLAGRREIFTVPDAVASRYDSRTVGGLAAVTVLVGTVAYLALQLQALGIVVRAVLGLDTASGALAIGLVVILAYSVFGGMIAGVYTDVAQGAVMLAAAVAVFARALGTTGGWTEMVGAVSRAPEFGPGFLDALGGTSGLGAFGLFFVFGIGVLGQPHMLHKFFMIDDPRKLRFMPLVLGLGQGVCVLIWLGIGLAVPALVAQGRLAALARPDDAAAVFLLEVGPDALGGLVFAGVLAAIMSTADSFLNIGAAALVRDLPSALGLPLGNQLRRGRVAVVVVAAVAAFFSQAHGGLIAVLGTFAFGTFAAGLAPALAVGLSWERVTAKAAGASIATGTLLSLGLELLARGRRIAWLPTIPAEGAPPAAVALAGSFAVLFAVTWASKERRSRAGAP